jgi:hypothetical protein
MTGIKSWIRNWLTVDDKMACQPVETAHYERSDISVNFNVTLANGGYIIAFNRWNRNTDKQEGGVYVRPSDCNLGQEIEQLFVLEQLKK